MMDHITGLPPSHGHNAILVIVDHDMTKGGVFIPCLTKDDVIIMAQHLINHIFKHFGLPDHVISDRGPLFTAKVRNKWCKIVCMYMY